MSAQVATGATPSGTAESGTVHIGTRRSPLAMKQAQIIAEALQQQNPDIKFEIHGMATMGDKDQTTALYNFAGKGLWTNELEAKLASKDVDLIVHCVKDMPTTLPEGFALACMTTREDPRDVVVFKESLLAKHDYKSISDLPAGSVVGTSSVRRIAQLARRYPDLKFADIRGSIETRLRKLDDEDGPFSAIILAAAGLLRMSYDKRIAQYLDVANGGMLYAVGQGALGLEAREDDERILKILKRLEDKPTMLACTAERSLMRKLEGGCSVPIGVETTWVEDGGKKLRLRATVVQRDGSHGVDADQVAVVESAEDAEEFGKKVAGELVEKGADKILDIINQERQAAAAAAATSAATST
jgi:hydroxymethylbilane synthase